MLNRKHLLEDNSLLFPMERLFISSQRRHFPSFRFRTWSLFSCWAFAPDTKWSHLIVFSPLYRSLGHFNEGQTCTRAKHFSVFTDSVKCKTRQRDLGEEGATGVDGLWKIEREQGKRQRGSFEHGEAFLYKGIIERGDLESLMAFEKWGQRRTSKDWDEKLAKGWSLKWRTMTFGKQ